MVPKWLLGTRLATFFRNNDFAKDAAETGSNPSHTSTEGKAGDGSVKVLDIHDLDQTQELKLTKDGRTVLVPQPSTDPQDPLNWSSFKKHVIVFCISFCAFLPDNGSATGAVVLLTQSKDYGVSPDTLNHASAGNQFMIGAGGPIAVGLSAYFGRLPVLFWFMVVAVATAAGNTGATTYESFLVTRVLNGFFSTVAQGGGLMFIKDMFFLHEHARKINLWQAAVIVSPFVGPMLSAFMIAKVAWFWPFVLYTVESLVGLLLVVCFVEETYYDRGKAQDQLLPRGGRLLRLIGIHQRRTKQPSNTFFEALMRPIKAISKPIVFLTNLYYLLTFAWAVGINSTLAQILTSAYKFTPTQIGYFYFIPIIATIVGEIAGHWLHDLLALRSARRNNSILEPEARLQVIWIATPLLIAGLLMIGFGLEGAPNTSYWIHGMGFALFSVGIMLASVGVNAYNLDCYPSASGEVAAWINFSRTTGGFVVGYFQVRWAAGQGFARSFGTQAGICAAAFMIVVALQIWGKRIRVWSGDLSFRTS